jgi:hypothetical protein
LKFFRETSHFLFIGILIFTPHLSIFGYRLKTIYIVVFIAFLSLIIKRAVDKKVFILLCLVCFLVSTNFIFNASVSVEVLRQIFIFLALFICFDLSLDQHPRSVFGITSPMRYIQVWLVLQSLVIISSALIDGFAQNFHSVFLLTERAERYIGVDVLVNRYSGFAASGFSTLSVYMGLLGVLVNETLLKSKDSLHRATFNIVLVFALFFVGRSGLYIYMVYILISGMLLKTSNLIWLSIFVFSVALLDFELSDELLTYLRFAFELILNGSSSSTDQLLEHEYFLPQPSFWGSGSLLRSEDGVNSDAGWVKLLYCFGYLGTIFFVAGFLYVFSNGFRLKVVASTVFVFFIGVFFLFNFKDLFFLSSGYIQAYIILYLLNRRNLAIR